MIGRLNHVAIAVPDIAKAADVYRKTLGAEISAAVPQPLHGVTTVFVNLPNTKIELLEPLGKNPCRPRPAESGGRPRARRRRAEDRCPWQAGALPASEGFLRDAGRARTGLRWRSPPG
jgi:catechol 2,3-dioxygenase-like lactoylglutathione lyase family enzyme